MDILFYVVLIMILFLLTVLIIRTIKFVPKKEKDVEIKNHKLDDKKIIQDMVDMIRIKTISNREEFLFLSLILISNFRLLAKSISK